MSNLLFGSQRTEAVLEKVIIVEQKPTFRVPSRVLAITTLFSESEASPVIALSVRFFVPPGILFAVSIGEGPTSKVFRLMPDCMFHIWICPVDELAIPKLPHAVTHTD